MAKPKNWRQIQAIRWHLYQEFKEIINEFFKTELLGLRSEQKHRLLDALKKETELYK
jgi:hypothetical protein